MTAVQRVKAYGELPTEVFGKSGEVVKQHQWPQHGKVEFNNYSLKYREGLPLVLKDVSFTIEPKMKVGVVGRTGAGKSSLMQALFRLVEPSTGTVLIDGIDFTEVGLHDLRGRCSVIPQDPILFTGSVRYNLDPLGSAQNDRELWKALEEVQLKDPVSELDGKLDFEVSEGGKNFSVGQRQLVCLARAILRKSKILLMDEATANVDPKTDSIIQQTVREKFTDCTVITIAHRLHTIIDSDRILVMSGGRVAAFGSPHELLQDPENPFSVLVDETGSETSLNLRRTASQRSAKSSTDCSMFSFSLDS